MPAGAREGGADDGRTGIERRATPPSAREAYAALEPDFLDRRYLNYLSEVELGQAAAVAYGPIYDRLAHLKAMYDPDNVFHMNLNVEPATNGGR